MAPKPKGDQVLGLRALEVLRPTILGQCDRRQAQRVTEALQQPLHNLGLPSSLVAELEGRLRSQQKLLGKIVGVMFPPLFGCRTNAELCRVQGWHKNLPSRLLVALPKRSWLKRLRRLGLEVLVPLWHYAALCQEITAWQAVHNHNQTRINGRFNTTEARIALKRLYPSVSGETRLPESGCRQAAGF